MSLVWLVLAGPSPELAEDRGLRAAERLPGARDLGCRSYVSSSTASLRTRAKRVDCRCALVPGRGSRASTLRRVKLLLPAILALRAELNCSSGLGIRSEV